MKATRMRLALMIICAATRLHMQAQDTIANVSPITTKKGRALLSGEVTNAETGEAPGSTSVYFPDLRIGGISNTSGLYKIKDLQDGKYIVEVSFLGYRSVVEVVELRGKTKKDFQLVPAYAEAEKVTVTGISLLPQLNKHQYW